MLKSTTEVDGKIYHFQYWISQDFYIDVYKINFQAWTNPRERMHAYTVRLSREFIEDEVDNDLRDNYLAKIVDQMLKDHLKDIIGQNNNRSYGNVERWMIEAKKEIDETA